MYNKLNGLGTTAYPNWTPETCFGKSLGTGKPYPWVTTTKNPDGGGTTSWEWQCDSSGKNGKWVAQAVRGGKGPWKPGDADPFRPVGIPVTAKLTPSFVAQSGFMSPITKGPNVGLPRFVNPGFNGLSAYFPQGEIVAERVPGREFGVSGLFEGDLFGIPSWLIWGFIGFGAAWWMYKK